MMAKINEDTIEKERRQTKEGKNRWGNKNKTKTREDQESKRKKEDNHISEHTNTYTNNKQKETDKQN